MFIYIYIYIRNLIKNGNKVMVFYCNFTFFLIRYYIKCVVRCISVIHWLVDTIDTRWSIVEFEKKNYLSRTPIQYTCIIGMYANRRETLCDSNNKSLQKLFLKIKK